jgi:hypothetical protein
VFFHLILGLPNVLFNFHIVNSSQFIIYYSRRVSVSVKFFCTLGNSNNVHFHVNERLQTKANVGFQAFATTADRLFSSGFYNRVDSQLDTYFSVERAASSYFITPEDGARCSSNASILA